MNEKELFTEFGDLLNQKKNSIYYRNSSAANRRIQGQYGTDRKFHGFRTIILYFQLNPDYLLKEDILYRILYYLEDYTDPGKTNVRKFLPLFFNNSDKELIFPGQMSNNANSVVNDFNEYMEEYTDNNKQYSKELNKLTAPYNIYAKKRFPSKNDLCVFFYEKNSLTVANQVKKELKRMRNNAIWFKLKGENIISVDDRIPED